MLKQEDIDNLENRIGPSIPKRFVDYLNGKGIRNSWGNPYNLANLTQFWNGRKEDLVLERHLLDFAESIEDERKALEARKKAFKESA